MLNLVSEEENTGSWYDMPKSGWPCNHKARRENFWWDMVDEVNPLYIYNYVFWSTVCRPTYFFYLPQSLLFFLHFVYPIFQSNLFLCSWLHYLSIKHWKNVLKGNISVVRYWKPLTQTFNQAHLVLMIENGFF